MEQKRTLWIVAAAGVFLLVVIGAALLLSFQKNDQAKTYYNPADGFVSSAKAPETGFEPGVPPSQRPAFPYGSADKGVAPLYEQDSIAGETPDTSQTQTPDAAKETASSSPEKTSAAMTAGNVTVFTDNTLVYGTGNTTTIDLNSLKSSPAPVATVTPQNNYTAAQMSAAAVPEQTQTTPSYKPSSESYYAPAPAATKTTAKKDAAVTSAPKLSANASSAKKSAATPAKTASAIAKVSTYWIQVGSYEAKKSADNARSALEANKIPNEVFTYKDSKGKLFYRVRVGPYTTKSEAEYWQKRIAATNEFANASSYVVKN